MGLWNSIVSKFSSNKVTASKVIELLNRGYSIMQISSDLYNIPEIRTAINFIAQKVASVEFKHVRLDDMGAMLTVRDRLHFILNIRTNQKQSPQIFWTQAVTKMLLYNNCFIMPEWDNKGVIAWLHIMPFSEYLFGKDEAGKIVIQFMGSNEYTFYYEDIIHLQRFPCDTGGTKKQATSNYIQIVNTIQNQAVNDAETSGRLAGLFQVKTALKGADMKKKLEEFKELFMTSENTTGFGMIGAEYELHKLDMKTNPLNEDLLNQVIKAIYNYFGVSPELINNNASELSYEQFVDNTLKPIVFQIEEELSYKCFTETEIYHFNRVLGETIDMEISTLTAKTMFFDKMLYHGILNGNEVRKRIGMGRVDGLDAYRPNLNSVDSKKINDYQGVGGGENVGSKEKNTGSDSSGAE